MSAPGSTIAGRLPGGWLPGGWIPGGWLPAPNPAGWWPLIRGIVVGYLRTALCLALLQVVAWPTFGTYFPVVGAGPAWPFASEGVWSFVGGAFFAVPLLVAASVCLRGSIAKRIGLPVSASWIFAVLAACYYGLLTTGHPLAFVVATIVLGRLLAVRRAPLWRNLLESRPVRSRRPIVYALTAASVAGFLAGGAYALTHPLTRVTVSGGGTVGNGVRLFDYSISNGSWAGVTVTGVRLRPSDAKRFAVLGFYDDWPRTPSQSNTGSIPRHGERVLALRARGGCPASGSIPPPSGVEVSYRMFGLSFEQFAKLEADDPLVC
jgi:hypothetical protein